MSEKVFLITFFHNNRDMLHNCMSYCRNVKGGEIIMKKPENSGKQISYKKPQILAQEMRSKKNIASCIRPDGMRCCECTHSYN